MSNELSDSLLNEVGECNELTSQWGEEMDAATTDPTGSTAADHIETAGTSEDTVPSPESLIPIPEHRIPESENELPNPLRHLITTAGVKLVPTLCGTWNIDGFAAKLHRPFSLTSPVMMF